jgi:AAA15 family ATPase/GTPase
MATWGLRDANRLQLGDRLYQEFDLFRTVGDSASIRELPSVSAINMFVGPNHSGKSRFLRSLAQDPELKSDQGPRFRHLKTELVS